jgi:hypothetical protein
MSGGIQTIGWRQSGLQEKVASLCALTGSNGLLSTGQVSGYGILSGKISFSSSSFSFFVGGAGI